MRRAASLFDVSSYVPVMTSTPQVAVPNQTSLAPPQLASSLQEKMEQQNKVGLISMSQGWLINHMLQWCPSDILKQGCLSDVNVLCFIGVLYTVSLVFNAFIRHFILFLWIQLIDQLMQMVNKLETDRNNYSEQMRDVRGVFIVCSSKKMLKYLMFLNSLTHGSLSN